MTERSAFFTSVASDRIYDQAELADVLIRIFEDGYFSGVLNDLAVTESDPNAMTVDVDTGEGWVQGFWYQNDATKVVTIPTADGSNPRIDRIVIRLDFTSDREVTIECLAGTPAGSPTAPALTQNASTWEISLAQVAVAALATSIVNANITDESTAVVLREGITAAQIAKLSGIETAADVTDATNVNAAGATMNNDTDVKANSWVIDEDDMVSDLDTKVPTEQSVKKYVDDEIAGVNLYLPAVNLVLKMNAANPTYQLDCDADQILLIHRTTKVAIKFSSVNVTGDISTTGAGGRNSDTAEQASKWYEVKLIGKADGTTIELFFINEDDIGAETYPADYDYSIHLGWVKNDSGSDFEAGYWIGKQFFYDTPYAKTLVNLAGGATPTSATNLDCSPYIPPTRQDSTLMKIYIKSSNGYIHLRRDDSASDANLSYGKVSWTMFYFEIMCAEDYLAEYWADNIGYECRIYVKGYEDERYLCDS